LVAGPSKSEHVGNRKFSFIAQQLPRELIFGREFFPIARLEESMTSSEITPLQINDKEFLIASTIERCPKVMMLRELMMNALEAALLAPQDHRLIEIRTIDLKGTPKLAIWNTGPGMNGQGLHDICDLASSIRKTKSLDGNFGMGAKVASLPSNRLGLRYRSCKHGRVHEVILCERGGEYGRLRRRDDAGNYDEVIDVTENVRSEGGDVSFEWTEAALFGNKSKQNTARDPYDGDPECDAQWLATYLYHRFYRLPEGVKVLLYAGTHKLGDGVRQFLPIPDRILAGAFDRAETIQASEGIKIHYVYDGPYSKMPSHNRSISGAVQSAVSTCAIIYKKEMFDVRKGRNWTLDAPIFGIPFGARHISVHVELPDTYTVRPESYRQFLRYNAGEQQQVYGTDFALLVAKYRPQWLIDLIRSFAPDAPSHDEIRQELQKLLDELKVRRNMPRVAVNGAVAVSPRDGAATQIVRSDNGPIQSDQPREEHIDLSIVPSGAQRADIWRNRERAPIIIPLRKENEIEEKQIKERAARYYDNGQLFVNMLYPSIQQMKEQLETEYADTADIDQMRALALQLAEETMILRVGRAVVFALAKQANKEWNSEAVSKALAPESLSLAADDFKDALQSARRKIGKTFRTAGTTVDRLITELSS
jgi:hypothetical protein